MKNNKTKPFIPAIKYAILKIKILIQNNMNHSVLKTKNI